MDWREINIRQLLISPIWELISNPDAMRANALELPDITKLALQLNKHGIPPWTIKYEQLEHYLQQLVEASHGD